MRFHERSLNLKFKKGTKRPDKSNAIDLLCSGQVPAIGAEKADFERLFDEADVPRIFSPEERAEFLAGLREVAVGSDAFVSPRSGTFVRGGGVLTLVQFPFVDNVYRAARSGVKYIAAPCGSQNDQAVFALAEELGITFIEQQTRLFHH